MSSSFAATVGNGRVLARIARDGSLISLATPQLDRELIEDRIHGVVVARAGNRSLSGKAWKHKLDYVRGTNVLRIRSSHSNGSTVERRLVAIGESLVSAFRTEDGTEVAWDRGLVGVLADRGLRYDGAWPDEFDPPPLAGATRASLGGRGP